VNRRPRGGFANEGLRTLRRSVAITVTKNPSQPSRRAVSAISKIRFLLSFKTVYASTYRNANPFYQQRHRQAKSDVHLRALFFCFFFFFWERETSDRYEIRRNLRSVLIPDSCFRYWKFSVGIELNFNKDLLFNRNCYTNTLIDSDQTENFIFLREKYIFIGSHFFFLSRSVSQVYA